MIERLVLPKGCSSTAENAIGDPSGSTLEPAHQMPQIDVRLQDYMNMIGHDDPSVKSVKSADCFAIPKRVDEHGRDTRLLKPERTGTGLIVPVLERANGGGIGTQLRADLGRAGGHRSSQAPREENDGIGRDPVRQSSAIEHSFPSVPGRPQTPMVCPTSAQHCSAKLLKEFARNATSRREFLVAAGGAVTLASCGQKQTAYTGPKPIVSIHRVPHYGAVVPKQVAGILREHRVAVRGKHVVLKPNLVEFDPATTINTNPAFVAGVREAFLSEGAASVRIAEGPGHRRATLDMAEAAGYFEAIPHFEDLFTDLNLDDVSEIRIPRPFSKLKSLYLPNTALGCDLLVSLPKLKTHHWAGATLSMKNFFGLVPGAVYGWPKNVLHWAGIPECIADLHNLFPKHFAIADGIEGMEGNGPIQGTPKHVGVIVAGADLPAVDATCCRIMGIDPAKIGYLQLAAKRGQCDAKSVKQIGETLQSVATTFALLPELASLRLA